MEVNSMKYLNTLTASTDEQLRRIYQIAVSQVEYRVVHPGFIETTQELFFIKAAIISRCYEASRV